ncbi:bacteriorhodopsin [Mangrovibacillus cuniculi]|uniref:Bacteriorhodopsin n=1 Tax=Mangrovibacillus cuniculi TaxID=2593652 RepID=A0A7S8CD58_9BACI|nr:bacteriorhodopsin [Mangrovibacillus cuniculi]QPC47807.1 bacteriorhodopsin [Mangrovibacillus cuniculi]
MPTFIQSTHVVYAFFMIAGFLYFWWLSRKPKGIPRIEYLIAMFIPVWSGTMYLTIAYDIGVIELGGTPVFFGRYLDWLITTPLLLVALALTAMFREKKKDFTILIALVIADIVMILTGMVADIAVTSSKWIWYSIGVIALICIFYFVFGPLNKIAKRGGPDLHKHYRICALYLSFFWIAYPVFWALSPSGTGAASLSSSVIAFIVLPIFSKVGFSILDITGLRKLSAREQ